MFVLSLASCSADTGLPDLIVTSGTLDDVVAEAGYALNLKPATCERLSAALAELVLGQVIEIKREGEDDIVDVLTLATVVRILSDDVVAEPFVVTEDDCGLPHDHPSGLGYVEDYDADNAAEVAAEPGDEPASEAFIVFVNVDDAGFVSRLNRCVRDLAKSVRIKDDDGRVTRPWVIYTAASEGPFLPGIYNANMRRLDDAAPRELVDLLGAVERAVLA